MDSRRDFLKKGLGLTGALVLGSGIKRADTPPPQEVYGPPPPHSRVIIARDRAVRKANGDLNSRGVDKLLKKSLEAFFDGNAAKGLGEIFKPTDKVGIKVNCLSGVRMSTSVSLVQALVQLLADSGIPRKNIIIWDRSNRDLKRAGFRISKGGAGPLCYGTDWAGLERSLTIYRSIGSLMSRILTQQCTALISLPVLKDHGIVGVTLGMKNFFGAIHNPNKYHDNAGDPFVADLFHHPQIKDKVKLIVVDALTAQYEGGPPYHSQWAWPFNGLLVGQDPVAVDWAGWQIIEEKRKRAGLKSLKETGREPTYIYTAATLGLGQDDPNRIERIEIWGDR